MLKLIFKLKRIKKCKSFTFRPFYLGQTVPLISEVLSIRKVSSVKADYISLWIQTLDSKVIILSPPSGCLSSLYTAIKRLNVLNDGTMAIV
jgi:hypothetical protein